MNDIERAIAAMGGQAAAARALNVTPGLVWQWVKARRTIGPDHCPSIEALSGVRCEELRPDIVWTRDKGGRVTGYHVAVKMSAEPLKDAA